MKAIKKEIDWSKGGQLMVSNAGEYVLASGDHGDYHFSGTDLLDGVSADGWRKNLFTLVEGPVTFEND